MKISIKNIAGKDQGELEVTFPLIENGKGTQAVHDVVTAYRAAQRTGTACTKNVGEVSGSNQSPLWVGGGVVFGPRPRDFSKTVSKKTRALSLRKALSERIKDGSVVIVDDLKLNSPKTKEFAGIISALDLTGTTLVVHGNENKNISLAARNLAGVTLTTGDSLNTYDVLRPDKLLFTKGAFETVEARLNKE